MRLAQKISTSAALLLLLVVTFVALPHLTKGETVPDANPPLICDPGYEMRTGWEMCTGDYCGSITQCVPLLCPNGSLAIDPTCPETPPPPPPPPVCTPSEQTRTLSCPAGQEGAISQKRSTSCPNVGWSEWVTISDTCAPSVVACEPLLEERNVMCPVGSVGELTERRTASCPGLIWLPWNQIGGSCVITDTPDECPNMSGVQPSIPDVMHKNAAGECVPLEPSCSTATDVRVRACPLGERGEIRESRERACPSGAWSGWSVTEDSCVPTPAESITLTVSPARIRMGETTDVIGTFVGHSSCRVAGGVIDPGNADGDNDPNVRQVSESESLRYTTGALVGETTYTLSCSSGTPASATVRLIPVVEPF